jgi:hypothetical protein
MDTVRMAHLARPTSLNQFVGNKSSILSAKETVSSVPFAFIILGPSGCGKSVLCDLLLQGKSFDILWVKSNDADDSKAMQKMVENFITHRTIESFFSKKPKVVIFDDVDAMMCSDRGSNSFLTGFIADNKKRSEPISFIMTCSTSEERKLTDFKKKISVIRLYNPPVKDAFIYICSVLDEKNISYDPGSILKLIENNDGNIRSVLMHLNFDSERRDATEQMFFDKTPFEITRAMLTTKLSCQGLRYAADNPLVPLLLYENFPSELFLNRVKQAKHVAYDVVARIIDGSISSECIEKYMYVNTDWDLLQPVSIMKCGYVNFCVNNISKKKSIRKDNLVFTQSLTKAASRHNYAKKIIEFKSELGIRDSSGIYKAFETNDAANEKFDHDSAVASYLSNIRHIESKPVRRATNKKKKTHSDS